MITDKLYTKLQEAKKTKQKEVHLTLYDVRALLRLVDAMNESIKTLRHTVRTLHGNY